MRLLVYTVSWKCRGNTQVAKLTIGQHSGCDEIVQEIPENIKRRTTLKSRKTSRKCYRES